MDYLLKGADEEQWVLFKRACFESGISMRESFLQHIERTVAQYRKLDAERTRAKYMELKQGKLGLN